MPGQDSKDHPDTVARVFRLKVQKLLEMLKSEMVFGKSQAWLYSIEWQKRGLPHCHLLLWLSAEHRITPDNCGHQPPPPPSFTSWSDLSFQYFCAEGRTA